MLGTNFADYETSIMLKQLGFNEECFNHYDNDNDNEDLSDKSFYLQSYMHTLGVTTSQLQKNKGMEGCVAAPLWQQVEEWLWLKYQIYFCMEKGSDNVFTCTSSRFSKEIFTMQQASDCPVIARIEGIRAVVKYFLTKN